MRLLRAIVAAAFVLLLIPAGQADTIELKFGHVGAPGSLFAISAEEFAKRANAALAGKAKITVFGASQLGKDKELLQKLKLGTVDFALPSTVMSTVVDEFGLFEMPYLVKDRNHMARIEKEIFWNKLAPAVEPKGYKIIAVWENGFRHITNNKRAVNVPADLQGLKLRTPKGKWRVKMFKTYGANPTPMSFSEVFAALQTGTMDGQENPYAQIYSAKFQEVQKYLSITGHVPGTSGQRHPSLRLRTGGAIGSGSFEQDQGRWGTSEQCRQTGVHQGQRLHLQGIQHLGTGWRRSGFQGTSTRRLAPSHNSALSLRCKRAPIFCLRISDVVATAQRL